MFKNLVLLILFSFLLTGCFGYFKNKEINDQVNDTKNIEINKNVKVGNNIKFEKKKEEVKVKNGKIYIGKNVLIQKGRSDDFPKDFPIIKGGELYKNSNMKRYAFYILRNKKISIYDIGKFYGNEMTKKGWIGDKNNKLEKGSYNISLLFTRKKSKTEIEEANIKILGEVPEVINENLKIDGKFIEIKIETNYIDLGKNKLSIPKK